MTLSRPILSILVASDLGDRSADVIQDAAALAAASGATLHVIHAHEEPSRITGDREVLSTQRRVHEKRIALLDLIDGSARGSAIGVTRVQVGSAAGVILSVAREVSADLIVLGAHRHRGVADRLLGSTAEEVIRGAGVPCLMLNAPLKLPIESVLVPIDFSETSGRALVTALSWVGGVGEPTEGRVTLAHVLDSSVEVENAPWAQQEVEADLERAAREAREEAGTSIPVDVEVLRGAAADALLDRAQQTGAGLLVLGTHGDRVIVRALLGSVSSAMVRRSPIPVLLVPRPIGAAAEPEAESAGPKRPAPPITR